MPADSPLGASPVTDRSITQLWDHWASYLLCIVKCVIKGELKLKLKLPVVPLLGAPYTGLAWLLWLSLSA